MSAQLQAYHEKAYTDGFFHVSGAHGFLPVKEPLTRLPEKYAALQTIMEEMPTNKVYPDVPGTLATPNGIEASVAGLPDYTALVQEETDVFIIQALYRAYTFLASAYTLELSYQQYVIDGNYGKARTVLPAHVAKPLVAVSEKLDVYPFLDYHYSYSLGNYVKKDPAGDLHWKNLNMACKFSGTPDEIGFIMLHVYINELSPALIDGIMKVGRGEEVSANLKRTALTMKEINSRRKEMWTASRHERYNDFRIFIMGIKGNEALYGDGLVYSGCFNDEPQQYRGQTGAQDSVIPMMDIFSGIVDHYPENKLTEYLMDLRTYRPKCIQEFFIDLRAHFAKNPLFPTLKDAGQYEELIYLLSVVNEVYLFRNGHWRHSYHLLVDQPDRGGAPLRGSHPGGAGGQRGAVHRHAECRRGRLVRGPPHGLPAQEKAPRGPGGPAAGQRHRRRAGVQDQPDLQAQGRRGGALNTIVFSGWESGLVAKRGKSFLFLFQFYANC